MKTLAEVEQHVELIEIIRKTDSPEDPIKRIFPVPPGEIIQENDRLVFMANDQDMLHMLAKHNLTKSVTLNKDFQITEMTGSEEVKLADENGRTSKNGKLKPRFPIPLFAKRAKAKRKASLSPRPGIQTKQFPVDESKAPTKKPEIKDEPEKSTMEEQNSEKVDVTPETKDEHKTKDTDQDYKDVELKEIPLDDTTKKAKTEEKDQESTIDMGEKQPVPKITVTNSTVIPEASEQKTQSENIEVDEPSIEKEERKTSPEFFEVVISSSNPAVGKSIRSSQFDLVYGANVIAIRRQGSDVKHQDLRDVILRPGDTLLLFAMSSFYDMWIGSTDFYVISRCNVDPEPHNKNIKVIFGKKFNLWWYSYLSGNNFQYLITFCSSDICRYGCCSCI